MLSISLLELWLENLARGVNRSVIVFSALVRNHSEPCLSANICTQFMDDNGCGVESIGQHTYPTTHPPMLTQNKTQAIARKTCLGIRKTIFFGYLRTNQGLQPENCKVEKFLRNLEIPKSVKQVKRLISFL